MKFRKKPVVIEAEHLTSESEAYPLSEWCGGKIVANGGVVIGVEITTLEGVVLASVGDYIIKGIKGEFYPCRADIFAATYEAV